MRRISLAMALAVWLVPCGSLAHTHFAGLSAGPAAAFQSELYGFTVGFDSTFDERCSHQGGKKSDTCPQTPFSVFVAVSHVWGTHDGLELKQYTLEAGPRLSHGHGPFRPFTQWLVGVQREDGEETNRTALTGAFGFGADIGSESKEWAVRPQFDMAWMHRDGITTWFPRVSISFVWNLEHDHD